jgi:polysaccharide export outer membrane protein
MAPESFSFPLVAVLSVFLWTMPVAAQSQPPTPGTNKPAATPAPLPTDYVIGVEDVLTVIFLREKDLTSEVEVRPDGSISLPMLNDIPAAGLTPEQLSATVIEASTKFIRDPGVTVMVKGIRSRKVYIVGEVGRPGTIQLGSQMNVLQALAEAGGLLEHANKGDIVVVRSVHGKEERFKFNYNDVVRGRNTQQNIKLLPGDTILVR